MKTYHSRTRWTQPTRWCTPFFLDHGLATWQHGVGAQTLAGINVALLDSGEKSRGFRSLACLEMKLTEASVSTLPIVNDA